MASPAPIGCTGRVSRLAAAGYALFACHGAPILAQNLLPNSGFQVSTNGSAPDYWDLHHAAQMHFPGFNQQFGLDRAVASPAQNSRVLRITNDDTDFPYLYLLSYRPPQGLPSGVYTFSVFVKGDRAGMRIVLAPHLDAVNERRRLSNAVGRDWTRIVATFAVADKPQVNPVIALPSRGTYWIAAPQLEAGSAASPYAPAASDLHLTDEPEAHRAAVSKAVADLPRAVNAPDPPVFRLVPQYDVSTPGQALHLRVVNAPAVDTTGTLRCEPETPDGDAGATAVSVKVSSGQTFDVDLSLQHPRPGRVHCVMAIGSQSADTSVNVLAPGSPIVRINRWNRTWEVDGATFMIRGITFGSVPSDWYLSDVAARGINTLIYYPSVDAIGAPNLSQVDALLRAATAHRLKVIMGPAVMGARDAGWDARIEHYQALIERYRGNPAIIGWFFADEPQVGSLRDIELQSLYRRLRAIDPYRPVFVNWNSDDVPADIGTQPHGTLAASDLYSIDCYPFMTTSTSLETYTLRTVRMLRTAAIYGRPAHSWLQMYGYLDAYREPTVDELRYMAYLNFLYGAGFSYWDSKSNSQVTWDGLSQIDHEIAALTERIAPAPDVAPLRAPALHGNFLYAIWKCADERVLIVLHTTADDERLELNLKDVVGAEGGAASDYFSHAPVALSGTVLTDRLGSRAVKIYSIR